MKECKRCSSTNLKSVDDYQYEDGELDLITPLNVIICGDCGCLHYKDDEREFWEYSINPDGDNYAEAAGSYATDFNVKAGLN